MEEKKRGRPGRKKMSVDFYKISAPCREDLALMAQNKIKLGSEDNKPETEIDKPSAASESGCQMVSGKVEMAYAGGGKANNAITEKQQDFSSAQIEALKKVSQTDEMLDSMLLALEQAGANQRWLDEAQSSFCCGMMEVYRSILKPQGI